MLGPAYESIWEYNGEGGRYYISERYPVWTQEFREEMANIMGQDWLDNLDEEHKAFDAGWQKFIEQLKQESKYRE